MRPLYRDPCIKGRLHNETPYQGTLKLRIKGCLDVIWDDLKADRSFVLKAVAQAGVATKAHTHIRTCRLLGGATYVRCPIYRIDAILRDSPIADTQLNSIRI